MKRSMLLKTSVLCLGFAGLTQLAFAGQVTTDESNVFTLGEIVVGDSSRVQDVAINNTVTAEEIESLGATTAAEALAFVPGVNLVQTTKGTSNITIQGFQQKDILVLIDGVPYYETKNGPLDLQQIPASIIGKIEVIKGASSVLYGPNAMGGVVNIITKKGVEGFAGSARVELGRDGYNREVASLNYGAENGFSVLGTVDYRRRDALRFSDSYQPVATKIKGDPTGRPNPRVIDDGGKKNNSELESLSLWTRLGYAPTDEAEVYASLYHYELERGRLFSDSYNKVKGAFSTFARYDSYRDMGVDLGGRVQTNDWLALRTMAFYHNHKDDCSFYESENLANKLATSTWDDDSYGVSIFSDMDLNRFGDLTLTAQYREDKHKDRHEKIDPYKHSKSDTFTLAGQETISWGPLSTVLGVGWNHFDVSEIAGNDDGYDSDSIDPMLGLTWTGESGLRLFGSVAKKTRFPTFSDMQDKSGKVYVLDPEKNINYTAGAEYLFFDRTNVTLSAFYNDVEDGIDTVMIAGNKTPTNIDSAKIYGIELSTDTEITERVNLGIDYTWTHARNDSADRRSDYLEDTPEHAIGTKISYQVPMIEAKFTLHGLWKIDNYILVGDGENVAEDSFVLDLSLLKDFDNGFTAGAYINNLLDADYYEGNGMASNGFNFKFIVQYAF
ncbi:TonB-dependent receptor plug domain-containing protein [Desulfotalea psychrophila]|uniref:Related to TonB dependent outer membrane receptor n=1 Tax=Desulfotalea psychrophila (strain LSv54 / DSM 12343) TaxID=177439 RepID=Q6AIX0_DESPS|nr:TonB-dependent receptor [Desulfotalea psychrophila]CAG37710.1 related to TonB dependent outer membrane receptor [Desulfotalea psychrophila LSv54]